MTEQAVDWAAIKAKQEAWKAANPDRAWELAGWDLRTDKPLLDAVYMAASRGLTSKEVRQITVDTGTHAMFMYGEQCADTDGMALHDEGRYAATYRCLLAAKDAQLNQQAAEIAERGVRIANHDRTIATLMTQLIGKDATIAGLRTEAQRLSELAQDLQAQLNARHGAAGELQTGVSIPCETLRVNPFAHGWATNWKMR